MKIEETGGDKKKTIRKRKYKIFIALFCLYTFKRKQNEN